MDANPWVRPQADLLHFRNGGGAGIPSSFDMLLNGEIGPRSDQCIGGVNDRGP